MIKKFLTYGIGSIGSALISFMITPFLTRILSTSYYGKGTLFITIISLIFFICNLGLDQGYVRFFYEKKSKQDKSKLFFQCLLISLVALVIIITMLYIYNATFLHFFFGMHSIRLYLCIVFGTFLFLMNRYLTLSLRMQNKAFLFSLVQICNSLFYFISIASLFVLYQIKNFDLIIYAQLISLFCITLFNMFINIHVFRFLNFKKIFCYADIYNLLSYSWPFLFSFIIVWGMQYIDRIFLIKLSDFSQLGIYSASFALIAPLVMFQGVFTTLWAPLGMNLLINHNYKGRLVYKVLFKNMVTFIVVGILVLFSLKSVIPLLLGSKFAESAHIFIWLLFVPLFNLMEPMLSAGISISKKTHWNIWATFVGFIINIISCIFFIPLLGAMGAAIALVLGNVGFISVKLISCMIYYKFRIDYKHLLISIMSLITCFTLASIDKFSTYAWFVFAVLLIYQLFTIIKAKNIKDIKSVVNFMKRTNL